MNFIDDYTFQFSFAVPNPVAVEWLPHPNRGVTPIKHAKHYFSQFHPTYVGAAKAEALAKEAGFESWVQHFSDLNNSWSELPKFNTDRPMLTAYRLAEIGTDLARWERNPYYWKIDVEGNQLPLHGRFQRRGVPGPAGVRRQDHRRRHGPCRSAGTPR